MKNKASLQNKIYRKLHWIFFSKLKPGKWVRNLYPAYCHGKKYAKKHGKAINQLVNDEINESDIYITQIPNEGAGIGHQMANYIGGFHYSMLFKTRHAYASFANSSWDSFLGFGQNETTVKELKKQGYKFLRLPYFDEKSDYNWLKNIIDSYKGKKVILQTELDQFYQKQYDVIPHIKKKFEEADARKEDKLVFSKDETNVAVHIRRGDITIGQTNNDASLTKRWLDLDYYEKTMEYVVNNIKCIKPLHIYIITQDEDDYSRFEKYGNVTVCTDMPAKESFLHMVRADILVTSKSSFSYKPALLADGIRICPSGFWHDYPEDDRWIVMKV